MSPPKSSGVLASTERYVDSYSVDVLVMALKRAREFIAQDTRLPSELVALELKNIDDALASLDVPNVPVRINVPGSAT